MTVKVGLPWRALDLDKGEVAVIQRLVVVDGKPTVRLGTKTPRSARRIALDAVTVAALKAHRARQASERLALGSAWIDTGPVFTREDCTPLRPASITRQFARLTAEVGLPALTLHGRPLGCPSR